MQFRQRPQLPSGHWLHVTGMAFVQFQVEYVEAAGAINLSGEEREYLRQNLRYVFAEKSPVPGT